MRSVPILKKSDNILLYVFDLKMYVCYIEHCQNI